MAPPRRSPSLDEVSREPTITKPTNQRARGVLPGRPQRGGAERGELVGRSVNKLPSPSSAAPTLTVTSKQRICIVWFYYNLKQLCPKDFYNYSHKTFPVILSCVHVGPYIITDNDIL